MIDGEQVQRRVASGEDERTEFKRGLGDLRGIGRALCAFANGGGGLLVLGVEDDGSIVGTGEAPEKLAERLTSFLHSGLSNPVSGRIGRAEQPSGAWIHWVAVPRQRGPEPMRFKGGVWVRRGRASVEPSPSELQDLYNAFGYILTEERTIEAGSVDDISLERFREYLDKQGIGADDADQPTSEQDLTARGVLAECEGAPRPTLYGILAFGKDPQRFKQTMSFWVECVAYGGRDRADEVLHVAEGKGRIDEQVERAVGWVRGLGKFERYEGLVRTDEPLVPPKAVREALVNAVAHRDYAITGSQILLEVFSDRLVVTNPGCLPNGITIDSVIRGGHPRSRNESMANFLLVMQKMEKRGRGWPVMRRAMIEHNGTEPEIQQDCAARFVRVTLWLRAPTEESGGEEDGGSP